MDKPYWEQYYKSHHPSEKPTLFAHFVMENHLQPGHTLVEFGCGNARDSVFFAKNGLSVIAVDQCDLTPLKEKHVYPNLKFVIADFTALHDMEPVDHVYSRFTLHSVSEPGENNVIDWASRHLKSGGKLHIEARGKKNELHKVGTPVPDEADAYIHDDHYRRFIDVEKLQKKLEDAGFQVLMSVEDRGFAPYQDTDQIFFRIIGLRP